MSLNIAKSNKKRVVKAIFDRHPDWRDKFWQFVRFGVVGKAWK